MVLITVGLEAEEDLEEMEEIPFISTIRDLEEEEDFKALAVEQMRAALMSTNQAMEEEAVAVACSIMAPMRPNLREPAAAELRAMELRQEAVACLAQVLQQEAQEVLMAAAAAAEPVLKEGLETTEIAAGLQEVEEG